MPRWVDDPVVVFDKDGEPVVGVVLATGGIAMLMWADQVRKAEMPVYRRLGRELRRVRVRIFHAVGEAGRFWLSAGYLEWSRLEWIALWFRAMRGARERIPRMHVVKK